jgi:O-acetyl-ADP-ribose deacetylase (regulator of RNase III)
MIRFTQGNLLDAEVDAVVNTVNTVGVMGKGIALMFKERFPENYRAYAAACKRGDVQVGKMFVTASLELSGPRWIINFPTKKHWRQSSKLEWISAGLEDLKRVVAEKNIRSIAIPPLGSGNGGLEWLQVRPLIEAAVADIPETEVVVYEPTAKYQNVAKGRGVDKLTPARALIAEMIRRYALLGLDCSILEVQKLAWVLTRVLQQLHLRDPLRLTFDANRYGPFAPELTHLLNALDGSYLHRENLATADAAPYEEAIDKTDHLIDGFQSPLGMEALATVDWLISREAAEPTIAGIRQALKSWRGGPASAERKQRLFSDRLLDVAIERVKTL